MIRASTPDDAVRAILEIARRRGVQVVAKGKSMISEELELNLDARGRRPDPGGDRSRRVDRPARRASGPLISSRRWIHRSRGQIAEVLAADTRRPHVGRSGSNWSPYSRERLRATFLEAGMGITGANFMVAESGTVDRARERGQRAPRLIASPLSRRCSPAWNALLETTADAAFMIEQLSLAAVEP